MPLGDFEHAVLRLLAANRNPDSYVAGATVFLRRKDSPRQSQDIDVFHDTIQSLQRAAAQDAATLQKNGFTLAWAETQETFRRATVSKGERSTKMEWAYDSAFRFFPVLSDAELGFVLHPLDGATNKLLALAGRISTPTIRPWFRTRLRPSLRCFAVTLAACAARGRPLLPHNLGA